MATESVTKRIPGLDDLLAETMVFRDPDKAALAAFNKRYPLERGLAAVGDLLWWASQHEDFPSDRELIGDVGCLVKELATITATMTLIENNATHQKGGQNDDGEFVSIPVIGRAKG